MRNEVNVGNRNSMCAWKYRTFLLKKILQSGFTNQNCNLKEQAFITLSPKAAAFRGTESQMFQHVLSTEKRGQIIGAGK